MSNIQVQGWKIIGYDVSDEARARATAKQRGLSVADSLNDLLKALNKKVCFLSTLAGTIINQWIVALREI